MNAPVAPPTEEIFPIVEEEPEERAHIRTGRDLSRIVDEAIEAIASADIYQRGTTLADITREASPGSKKLIRPEGTPTIRVLPHARLRETIISRCKFMAKKKIQDPETGEIRFIESEVPAPSDIPPTVSARGEWAHIRPLMGITNYPVIRPDGSLLTQSGYDWATALIVDCDVEVNVPDHPTHDDAREALKLLHDLVSDFPFANEENRAAWLSGLLTPLTRPAVNGPVPLTVIDANERGTGKSLLGELISLLVTGRDTCPQSACETEEEWNKTILSIGIAGDPLVVIDNITGKLKSKALDIVLTATSFQGRMLGQSQMVRVPWRATMIATANNCLLSRDLVRRSVHVRLDSPTENPEARQGFTIPNIKKHAKEHRARYLSAALTIVRAYVEAGSPRVKMRAMGSYEQWSQWVRAPLIWAGESDPTETQTELLESADTESEAMGDLYEAWFQLYGSREITVRELVGQLGDHDDRDPRTESLRTAVGLLCNVPNGKSPSARQLGASLRQLRGRYRNNMRLDRCKEHTKNGATWHVMEVGK